MVYHWNFYTMLLYCTYFNRAQSDRRIEIIELTTSCRHRQAVRNSAPPAPVFQQSICSFVLGGPAIDLQHCLPFLGHVLPFPIPSLLPNCIPPPFLIP